MPKFVSRGKECVIVAMDSPLWTSNITVMAGATLAVECPLDVLRLHLKGDASVVVRATVQKLEMETSVPDGVSVTLAMGARIGEMDVGGNVHIVNK